MAQTIVSIDENTYTITAGTNTSISTDSSQPKIASTAQQLNGLQLFKY